MFDKTDSKLKDSYFVIIHPATYLFITTLGLIGFITLLKNRKNRSYNDQHVTSSKILSQSEVEALLMESE
ncbi:hypothetical protein PVA17_16080 [Lysinibacillus sp. CNPSo 3705]|uniref:hypothetical protein n=1 Tax=Lysinibacillus sp. CNPSo 3705 TaxID=3028148 RepID=UPI002363E6D6|nr:hypothetical protein [Lysinibacillus sp. CNPSo 3705]MDD1504264.1 hypothetical protein [Lysinibacillus sp. CNPSo 3705]